MNDEKLRHALRSLPAPSPPRPGFTGRVLARLDEEADRARRPVARWAAAAAAAALALGLGAWGLERERDEARRAELAALQRDAARLERELEALQDESEPGPPVLYLGGTEEVDLVLDLRRFAASPATDS